MKRLFFIFLILCGILTGCSQETQPATQTTVPAQPPLLGLCIRDRSEDPAYYDALEQALQKAGYRLSIADCRNDQSLQDTQIAAMVESGCALLLCEPVMVTALETVIDTAAQAGLPLILLNYQPDPSLLERWEKLSYIGFDPAEPALLQAQAAAGLPDGGDLNEDGQVSYAILTGPEDHLDAQLHIAGADWETGALLATEHTDWSSAQGQTACGRLLSKYGLDLEVIACGSPQLAQGALLAVEAGGWRAGQDGYLLAIGGGSELLSLVLQGSISATVIPDTQAQQTLLLQTIDAMENGLPTEKQLLAPYIIVTQENAGEYLP